MSFIWIFSTHWKTSTAWDSRNHSLKELMASPEQLHKPCLCTTALPDVLNGQKLKNIFDKMQKNLTWGLLNQCRFEPGSNPVRTSSMLLNPELNSRSGSAQMLNFELDFGPVLIKFSSNFGSGPNFGNTSDRSEWATTEAPVCHHWTCVTDILL